MIDLSMLLSAPAIMAMTAAVAAIAAIHVSTRPVRTEQGIYARRMAGTMLGALALILAIFCAALLSWSGAG